MSRRASVAAAAILAFSCGASAADSNWQNLIGQDCSPTLRGSISKLADEGGFWAHVFVDMRFWMQDQRDTDPMGFCRAQFQSQLQRDQLVHCINGYRAQYDWFNRCMPSVRMMCLRSGGHCSAG